MALIYKVSNYPKKLMENCILMRRVWQIFWLSVTTKKFLWRLPPSCNDRVQITILYKNYVIDERRLSYRTVGYYFHKIKVDRRKVQCLCVALTYFHVSIHPLHDDKDAVIGKRIVTEHRSMQKNKYKYCKWCLKRIHMGIGQAFSSSDSSLSSKQIWVVKFA